MERNIAVIFAGGSGTRMNTKSKPKQFLEMNGKPIIIHTMEYFENNKNISDIVVSCISDWTGYLEELCKKYHLDKVREIVPGGDTGQESIYKGLLAAERVAGGDDAIVLIHDGVRPLISQELIDNNIETARKYGSAITVTPVTETIVISDNTGNINNVAKRENCYHAKAPQTFYLKDILEVHKKAISDGQYNMIDSATMMQYYGKKLHTVQGDVENIKITNPADFYIFRSLYEARENSQIFGL